MQNPQPIQPYPPSPLLQACTIWAPLEMAQSPTSCRRGANTLCWRRTCSRWAVLSLRLNLCSGRPVMWTSLLTTWLRWVLYIVKYIIIYYVLYYNFIHIYRCMKVLCILFFAVLVPCNIFSNIPHSKFLSPTI